MDLILINQRNYGALAPFYGAEVLNSILLNSQQIENRNFEYVRSLQLLRNSQVFEAKDSTKPKKVRLKISYRAIFIIKRKFIILMKRIFLKLK